MRIYCVLLLLTFFSAGLCKICAVGETAVIDDNSGSVHCLQCKQGCNRCFKVQDKIVCDFCDSVGENPFYRTGQNACSHCADGCSSCFGPSQSDCSRLKRGYFYDDDLQKIKKCKDKGCGKCNSKGECVACLRNHKRIQIEKRGNEEIVSCVKCQHPKCSYCNDVVSPHGEKREECTSCELGYGLANDKQSCQDCPDHCSYCGKKNICLVCHEGYRFGNGPKKACVKSTIEGCIQWDNQSMKCQKCKFGMLLETQGQAPSRCVDCSVLHPGCQYCRALKAGEGLKNSGVSEHYKNIARCTSCISGTYLDNDTGICKKNPENCNNFWDGLCQGCINGFYQKGGKCIPNDVANCNYERKENQCANCKDNYFLTKDGACQKCHSSCLSCDGPKEDQCTLCGVNKYKIEIVSKTPGGMNRGGMNKMMWRNLHYKCFDKCPEGGKFTYTADSFTRLCMKGKKKSPKDEDSYIFERSNKENISGVSMLYDSLEFYKKYKNHTFKDRVANKYKQISSGLNFDHKCSFKGIVKEKLSAEKETFFECKCKAEYYGARCQTSIGLYKAVNSFIHQMIRDIASTKIHEHELIEIIRTLNKTPVNKFNLDLLSETMQKIQRVVSFESSDVGNYLTALDYILQNYYEIMQENHRRKGAANDIDAREDQNRIFSSITSDVHYSSEFLRSNLHNKGAFLLDSTPTYSLQAKVFNKTNLFYTNNPMIVSSPYIDTSSDHKEAIKVFPHFKYLQDHSQDIISVIWSYASELFKQPDQGFFATNIVRIHAYKHDKLTDEINPEVNGREDFLKIIFPLRVEPAQEDLKANIQCVRFSPKTGSTHEFHFHKVFRIITDDRDKMFVQCDYTTVDLANDYYAAVYQGDAKDTRATAKERSFEDGDEYVIDDYKVPKDKQSLSLVTWSLFLLLLKAVIH